MPSIKEFLEEERGRTIAQNMSLLGLTEKTSLVVLRAIEMVERGNTRGQKIVIRAFAGEIDLQQIDSAKLKSLNLSSEARSLVTRALTHGDEETDGLQKLMKKNSFSLE